MAILMRAGFALLRIPSPSPLPVLIVGPRRRLSESDRASRRPCLDLCCPVGFSSALLLEEIHTPAARDAAHHRFGHVLYGLRSRLIIGYLVMGLLWPWSIMEARIHSSPYPIFALLRKTWKECSMAHWCRCRTCCRICRRLGSRCKCRGAARLAIAGVFPASVMSLVAQGVPARRKTILLC